MNGSRKILLGAVMAMTMISASPAFADNGWERHGYDKNSHMAYRYTDNDDDRHSYHHGTSKRHNEYAPSRYSERKYMIGYPLPYNVMSYPVSYEIRSHLRPLPRGYHYVRVDNDILLMNAATQQVIDAFTLLSGIGRH